MSEAIQPEQPPYPSEAGTEIGRRQIFEEFSRAFASDVVLEASVVSRPIVEHAGLWAFETAPIEHAKVRAMRFGRFSLIEHSRELLADGVPIPLGNRAIDVLFTLIGAGGLLVTKDQLLSGVWPKAIVEENCLQFQVSSLRKALGKDRDFIKTVSGRGYRFVADVRPEERAWAPDTGGAPAEPNTPKIAHFHEPFGQGNLKACTSDIIGREAHLLDVAALVMAHRLVTLIGPGGIGKTRLATELARYVLPKFGCGVWVVELGSLSDPVLVLPTIAATLGLGRADTIERLAVCLGSRQLMLVLDNCEHVIDEAASVAEALLHANASLRVLATSREPLRANGEWVYGLKPLEVPPEGDHNLEEVQRHSAAKLFVTRASAAGAITRRDELGGTAVAKICRRLDGIPLAIELAGASAALVGVDRCADQLDNPLKLLTNGRRTAPARHRTLRATHDWSYDLLSEHEQLVMRRLAVFAGDFTIEAATALAASGDATPVDVDRCLTSLVRKSIVVPEFDGFIPRYRFLETMRVYAMDKLTESGEYEAMTIRHAGLASSRT